MDAESTVYFFNSSNLIHALTGLLLAGIGYAVLVRYLRRRSPNHGYTAFLVVGGVLIVAGGFALVSGLQAAVVLVLCMGAAGVPMIAESMDNHLRNEDKQRRLDL